MMKSLIRLNPERKNTREYQLQNVTATVAYCSSGIVTQPYTCWLINIVSVYLLTSHSVFGRGGPLSGSWLSIFRLSISYTGLWRFVGLLFCSSCLCDPISQLS
ncbi:unnamed protein product [Arctogadus glacialis]